MNQHNDLHTISLFVANKPGVLLRVTIVFARRGFNIESLVVSSAFDGRYSRMTITAKGNDKDLDQIVKQLGKLVDVIESKENTPESALERELALIKLSISDEDRNKVLQIVDHFKAKTIDITNDSLIIEVSGGTDKVTAFIDVMAPFKVIELVRSGKMVMHRGSKEATINVR
ncbi:MAG: acetolactate synthase small subunit [Candidatus Margulisbacteria bacterium]|nr:acetolactate synthase small subunit [Candidatus Margulisiibacteriota bacterium]|tara:strand:+ start:141 stop:656 length:516 start_codon:yes stop_codon:yes gene_type:complete